MDIKHTYGFTATYENGVQVVQNDDDKSELSPEKSRFYDVLEYEKTSKLESFVIHNEAQSVGVDLRDGHFEINGIPFFQHRQDLENYKDFRVIYYRTVQRVINQMNGEEVSGQVLGYTVGWQTNDKSGANVQRTVTI